MIYYKKMRKAREKQMKKKLALVLILVVAFGVSGCSSGVSRAEYEKVVQERNEYKAQLDALTGETGLDSEPESDTQTEQNEQKEFKIGETWEVDGKFKLVVNSVTATDDRNQFDESNPAAVYIINYTYENLGVSDELYVSFEDMIVDATGKTGYSYPGDIEKYPQSIPVGANCEAEACVSVDNAGSFKDYVSVYDDEFNEYRAIFNLEVQ